jgi:hypothetical protein
MTRIPYYTPMNLFLGPIYGFVDGRWTDAQG